MTDTRSRPSALAVASKRRSLGLAADVGVGEPDPIGSLGERALHAVVLRPDFARPARWQRRRRDHRHAIRCAGFLCDPPRDRAGAVVRVIVHDDDGKVRVVLREERRERSRELLRFVAGRHYHDDSLRCGDVIRLPKAGLDPPAAVEQGEAEPENRYDRDRSAISWDGSHLTKRSNLRYEPPSIGEAPHASARACSPSKPGPNVDRAGLCRARFNVAANRRAIAAICFAHVDRSNFADDGF